MGQAYKIHNETFILLYNKGLNDAEVAHQLDVDKSAIWYKRNRMNLPPNTNRGAQKGERNPVFKAIASGNWTDPSLRLDIKEKISQTKIGERNPMWKGGITPRPNYRKVLERRGQLLRICQRCGSESKIEIHHIDGKPKNNNLANIKFLCRSCQLKVHGRFNPPICQICMICGKSFYDYKSSNRKFCSRSCANIGKKQNPIRYWLGKKRPDISLKMREIWRERKCKTN